MKGKNWFVGSGCSLAVLLGIVLSNPRAEIGINDDWSFIFSAKRLAETGHIAYNGWSAAILGVQLYFGALFIHLFGFSFTAVRASSMCLAVLSAGLGYALLTKCGIRPWNAALGTLTLTLSPLFLALATTFMTDSNALFFTLLFFYACVCCDGARSEREAMAWLTVASLAGIAGGSIRQIVFLCNLMALPGLVWHLRKRRKLLAPGLALWLSSIAAVFAIIHWFNHQPYVAIEPLYFLPDIGSEKFQTLLLWMLKSIVTCLFLTSPMLFAIALQFPRRQPKHKIWAASLLAGIVIGVHQVSVSKNGGWWGQWLMGNYVAVYGRVTDSFVIGPAAPVNFASAQTATAMFLIGSTLFAAITIWYFRREDASHKASNVDATLIWTAVPFAIGYLLLIYTRFIIFDRYFLPVVFLAILFALRWFERHIATGPSYLTAVPVALLALYGVANAHDIFAAARARLTAINEIRAAGIPRDQIRDGFEFDGWTQLEHAGYVNEPRMHPASAYVPVKQPEALLKLHPAGDITKECSYFFYFYSLTPAVHAHYVLQNSPDYCFKNAGFSPVPYRRWLPPFANSIYIGTVTAPYR